MTKTIKDQDKRTTSATEGPVSSETVGALIRQIEVKHDLLQYEIDGWCIWPVLRFPAAMALMNLPFTKSKEPFRLRELFRIAAKDLPRLIFPRRSRYVVITFSSALMEQEGECYKDTFFDDLLRELRDFYKIEKLNNKSFLPRSRAALIKRDVTSAAFDLLITLVLQRLDGDHRLSDVAEKLSASLSQEPGLSAFTPQRITAELKDFYWRKKLYFWLLGRIRPSYLFTADGYSEHAVIAAAKERGIRVCEFQHGGFIAGGPEYAWSSYATAYQARMPIADQFFLFGDYWKEQLDVDGFWGERLHAVGSLRVDQYRRAKSNHQSGDKNGACKIVLTTQGIDTEKLITFINDFLRMAEGKLEIELYIKLHPVFESNKEIYERPFHANKKVHVIAGSEAPSTFELLSRADLHLSISSTCHYDALGLGVPTVIIPLANCGWILPLHRAGHAFLAPTPEALLEIALNLRYNNVPDELSAYYFKPCAVENMKRALEA